MTVEDAADDVVLLEHDRHDLIDRDPRLLAVGRRVIGQSVSEVLRDADVVNDETAGLIAERPVHSSNRLHKTSALHWLVDIHRVERRESRSR